MLSGEPGRGLRNIRVVWLLLAGLWLRRLEARPLRLAGAESRNALRRLERRPDGSGHCGINTEQKQAIFAKVKAITEGD